VTSVRGAFLDTSEVSRALLHSPEVQAKWDEPSALERWDLRGLAGHLVRGTTSVEYYLDQDPAPEGRVLTASEYYSTVVGDTVDIDSDLNRAIRERGDKMAAEGYAALMERFDSSVERLRARLEAEPSDRKVRVLNDLVLLLDEYLVTRLIELTVHIDDVAVSAGLPTPEMPPAALDLAFGCLIGVARHRHGDIAVLRGLTRRERADENVLRAL
jgi:uncharacterized protein (TIGR03083 family)